MALHQDGIDTAGKLERADIGEFMRAGSPVRSPRDRTERLAGGRPPIFIPRKVRKSRLGDDYSLRAWQTLRASDRQANCVGDSCCNRRAMPQLADAHRRVM